MESHRTYSRLKCENELVNSKASYNHSVKLGWRFSRFSHVQLFVTSLAYSPPGSSVHGILQARILEWVAMPSSRRSSQPRDWTWFSCIAGRFLTIWATREAQSPFTLLFFFPYWQICFFNLYQYLPGISIRFFLSAECHCSIPMNRTRQA